MVLIVVYLVLVAVAQVFAFRIGQALDQFVPSTWSMLMFRALFFGVLWLHGRWLWSSPKNG